MRVGRYGIPNEVKARLSSQQHFVMKWSNVSRSQNLVEKFSNSVLLAIVALSWTYAIFAGVAVSKRSLENIISAGGN
jgi:hypothetical protein